MRRPESFDFLVRRGVLPSDTGLFSQLPHLPGQGADVLRLGLCPQPRSIGCGAAREVRAVLEVAWILVALRIARTRLPGADRPTYSFRSG